MSAKLTQRKKGDGKNAADAGGSSAADAEKKRYCGMIEELAKQLAPEKVQPFMVQAAPFIASAIVAFQVALPYIMQAAVATQAFLEKLPQTVLMGILGICVCFFGGVFPATIAAFEAWRLCGGVEALRCAREIWAELAKVAKASDEDDKKDADKDGKADVDELNAKELLKRKTALALRTVEPERLNSAISSIYTGWIGVLAVLKVQFARTVTLGEVVGEKLYHFSQPAQGSLKNVVPEEYHRWVPVGCRWACTLIAVSIAWWLTRIASAFHSAIRGGQMVALYLKLFLKEQGIAAPKIGGFDIEDEHVVGWIIAAAGFLFQLACGFSVPFPLNLVLWPISIVEWFIVYSVSS
eukprot:TRINITY_DN104100_c0_g1_i1.p1 TRINITY_DN104100_c0_g1~~TRINITY_DN104100_c0_g1_i1.p1  ORF type:complete len:352 (+),score=94.06 TRINITY_DN104100_c0_g1_i1:168-1223(+)